MPHKSRLVFSENGIPNSVGGLRADPIFTSIYGVSFVTRLPSSSKVW
jgi:hypothetical protein